MSPHQRLANRPGAMGTERAACVCGWTSTATNRPQHLGRAFRSHVRDAGQQSIPKPTDIIGKVLYVPAGSPGGNRRGFYVRIKRATEASSSPPGWTWIDGVRCRRDGTPSTDARHGHRVVNTVVDLNVCKVVRDQPTGGQTPTGHPD